MLRGSDSARRGVSADVSAYPSGATSAPATKACDAVEHHTPLALCWCRSANGEPELLVLVRHVVSPRKVRIARNAVPSSALQMRDQAIGHAPLPNRARVGSLLLASGSMILMVHRMAIVAPADSARPWGIIPPAGTPRCAAMPCCGPHPPRCSARNRRQIRLPPGRRAGSAAR